MEKISVWSDTAELPDFPHLEGDIKADVLIIGGGITGILCAYQLKQAGISHVLVEAGKLCSGITKNTTAKITVSHGLLYDGLIRRFGQEKAGQYLAANEKALAEYRKLCSQWDCGFEKKDSYVYTLESSDKIERELRALELLGCHAEYAKELQLPFQTKGAVKVPDQAQFHPLKFVAALLSEMSGNQSAENPSMGSHAANRQQTVKNLSGVKSGIYENTRVLEFTEKTVLTDKGKIRADKIIVTTHFPMLNKYGSYFLKMYQSRSYALALQNAPLPDGMYVDEAEKGMSFRSYGDLLLIGGGDHRTGKKGGKWQELEEFAHKNYPAATEKYRWAAQDCMTLDSVPYIGHYSAHTPDLYVATGFNKWGISSAMAAATLLTDMIMGKENPCFSVFSPSRSMLRPQLLVNSLEAVTNLLTLSGKRCPHVGCTLKWNPEEHSWDCPCHGSRFTEQGKLLDNPATGDLKRAEEWK